MVEARDHVPAEVDRLHVNLWPLSYTLSVLAYVVMYICEENRNVSRCERLREGNVHLVLLLKVNEGAQAELQRLKLTWPLIGVLERLGVKALLELDQVDVVVRRYLALEVYHFWCWH